jgi:hypothetical protein
MIGWSPWCFLLIVELQVTLSLEEERHCTVHGGNARQRPEPACRRGTRSESDRLLARAMRLAGVSRSAIAVGDQNYLNETQRGMKALALKVRTNGF